MNGFVLRWLGVIALWAAIGLVLSSEVYFNVRLSRPDVAFWEVAVPQFQRALLWAVLVPVILRLRRRVPLSAGLWLGGVGFHLAVSFAIMAAYYLVRILHLLWREGDPLTEFWVVAQKSFFGRNLIDMVFYWAVIGFGHLAELNQKYQQEALKAAQLESRLIEAELKALKQQLHPHFLFNTMNTIAVLVREGKNDEAFVLLARLGALLRHALENPQVQVVTLRQEMEFLERYLEIQQARFPDRLAVRTAISAAAFDARIPNLLLQPVVENAILHGIARKDGPGTLEILGEVREGRLRLEVRDDGPGFVASPSEPVKEGIGLSNTRERLAKLYGADHQLVLRHEKGRGVTVLFVLPYRT